VIHDWMELSRCCGEAEARWKPAPFAETEKKRGRGLPTRQHAGWRWLLVVLQQHQSVRRVPGRGLSGRRSPVHAPRGRRPRSRAFWARGEGPAWAFRESSWPPGVRLHGTEQLRGLGRGARSAVLLRRCSPDLCHGRAANGPGRPSSKKARKRRTHFKRSRVFPIRRMATGMATNLASIVAAAVPTSAARRTSTADTSDCRRRGEKQ